MASTGRSGEVLRRSGLKSRSGLKRTVLAAGILLLSGCSLLRPGAVRGLDLTGDYDGYLEVEQELVRFTLELLQASSSLSGRLESEDGLVARGRGHVSRSEIHLEFRYDTDCEGAIVLDGEATDEGTRLVGEFEAEDCTGRSAGAFELRR